MSLWSEISKHTIEVIAPIATAAGGWLVWKVGSWFTSKTGINVDDLLKRIVREGIGAAEKAAKNWLKKHKTPMPAERKKEIALEHALKAAVLKKVPKKYRKHLDPLIEAELGLDDLLDDLGRKAVRAIQ